MASMHVTRLSVTPIKGLELHHPPSIDVTETGAVGDRRFYLVDADDRLFSVAKTGALFMLSAHYDEVASELTISEGDVVLAHGIVEGGGPHTANFFDFRNVHGSVAHGPWDDLFSDRVGRHLRLVKADVANGGVDVEPLTLLGDASTRRLAEQARLDRVDARRFRMLIDLDGAEPHAEDGWRGRRAAIGTSVIEVGGPVQRCAGTTRHPESGQVDLRTLTLIGDYRGRQDSIFGAGFNFGVYARTIVAGRISVGDDLELVE
jgi:uncharacterized protein YcbX